MLIHKTKVCVAVGRYKGAEELILNLSTEDAPDFILPAGFSFTWVAVDFMQAHEQRRQGHDSDAV